MTLKILIVEDAGFVREILSNIVTDLGHHVIGEATTGIEAVSQALQLKPDLIFMDLVLPEKNGIEAAAEIREVLPGCRIIAVTSLDDEFILKKAQHAGCILQLRKPFSRTDVAEVLKQIHTRHMEVRHG